MPAAEYAAGACPSSMLLDAFALEGAPAGDPVAAHLASCVRCQTRVAELERIGATFEAEVFPATAMDVASRVAAAPAPQSRRIFLGGTMALAAAAALLFVVGLPHSQVESTYQGVKGSIGLELYAKRGGQTLRLRDGDRLATGDALLARSDPSQAGYLMVVLVDAQGRVDVLHPFGGEEATRVSAGALTPQHSAVLDDAPGPYRVFTLLSPGPFTAAQVSAAVHAGGAEALRALHHLSLDAAQATLLLEK